jgi:hypothetical protein
MLLALLLTYAGFTALCLSMPRHHAELLGAKPSTRRRQGLALAGWLLLPYRPRLAMALAGLSLLASPAAAWAQC